MLSDDVKSYCIIRHVRSVVPILHMLLGGDFIIFFSNHSVSIIAVLVTVKITQLLIAESHASTIIEILYVLVTME